MASSNSKQMTTGKAFEYALLAQCDEKLRDTTPLEIIKNSAYAVAKSCFDSVSPAEQNEYLLSARFAIEALLEIEPRLSHGTGKDDVLQLEILSDHHGKSGDVRDVIARRVKQNWEIGVSAKNNHMAVKHSRLSSKIDFGEKWLGVKVSDEYFNTVRPIFGALEEIRKKSGATKKWSELGDHHTDVYVPILTAFIKELNDLYKKQPKQVAANLVGYLVGNKDFYKVIKRKGGVEIHAYNLTGTLNLPSGTVLPKYVTPKVPLPTEIVAIDFKLESSTTAVVTMNNDWVLSFRIHNASSRVEASLKFDITLLKAPEMFFKTTLLIGPDTV